MTGSPPRPTAETRIASDPPLRTVELPQGLVAYTDEGPAAESALLAVHGVPGSVRDFRYLAPHLTDTVRFIRVDLPGFGNSPPSEAAVRTLSGRAAVLCGLADVLGLQRFGVVGHSMGGAAALVAAAQQPQRVELVVLVASIALSAHRGLGIPPRWFAGLAAALERPWLARALVPLLRAQYKRRRFGGERLTAAEFAVHCRAIAAADFALLRRAAATLQAPAIVAYAPDDPLVQAWLPQELATVLPNRRVLAFADGGHHLQKTRAAELAAAIKEALSAPAGT